MSHHSVSGTRDTASLSIAKEIFELSKAAALAAREAKHKACLAEKAKQALLSSNPRAFSQLPAHIDHRSNWEDFCKTAFEASAASLDNMDNSNGARGSVSRKPTKARSSSKRVKRHAKKKKMTNRVDLARIIHQSPHRSPAAVAGRKRYSVASLSSVPFFSLSDEPNFVDVESLVRELHNNNDNDSEDGTEAIQTSDSYPSTPPRLSTDPPRKASSVHVCRSGGSLLDIIKFARSDEGSHSMLSEALGRMEREGFSFHYEPPLCVAEEDGQEADEDGNLDRWLPNQDQIDSFLATPWSPNPVFNEQTPEFWVLPNKAPPPLPLPLALGARHELPLPFLPFAEDDQFRF